jgi:hypothetical protein
MKKRTPAILLILLATIAFSSCRKDLTRAQAEQFADARLHEYCARNGLAVSQFAAPSVSSTEDFPWIFDYGPSSSSPRHLVRISIDRFGHTELNSLVE